MKVKSITISAELRNFLAESMIEVANGTMTPNQGKGIASLANQIHQSLYTEIRMRQIDHASKQIEKGFGDLQLVSVVGQGAPSKPKPKKK
jgi:hypothetical protein